MIQRVAISIAAATASFSPAAAENLVLRHVTIISMATGRVSQDQEVVVKNGVISTVRKTPNRVRGSNGPMLEGRGHFLIPGLWDAHTHLSYLGRCALPQFVREGVTTVRDLGSRDEEIAQWRHDTQTKTLLAPRIFSSGRNLESRAWLTRAYTVLPPEGALWRYGPRLEIAAASDADRAVRSLTNGGSDVVKFRNLEPEQVFSVLASARRHNVPVAGHAPRMNPATVAEAGLRSFEHAETLTLALGERTEAERLALLGRIARAGSFLTPTLTIFKTHHLAPPAAVADWLSTTSRDPARAGISAETLNLWRLTQSLKSAEGDQNWAALYRRQLADTRLAVRAGVPLLAGTDVGSVAGQFPGLSLHKELETLVREVGLTPLQALQASTILPARFFGGRAGTGEIEAGQRADMLLLDTNPLEDIANARKIEAVILRGRVLYRSELQRAARECAG